MYVSCVLPYFDDRQIIFAPPARTYSPEKIDTREQIDYDFVLWGPQINQRTNQRGKDRRDIKPASYLIYRQVGRILQETNEW